MNNGNVKQQVHDDIWGYIIDQKHHYEKLKEQAEIDGDKNASIYYWHMKTMYSNISADFDKYMESYKEEI